MHTAVQFDSSCIASPFSPCFEKLGIRKRYISAASLYLRVMMTHFPVTDKSIKVFGTFCLMVSAMLLLLAPLSTVNGAFSTLPAESEAKFVIYPDGTVGLAARGNATGMVQTSGSTIDIDAQFFESANTQGVSMNATMTLPSEQVSQFPLNVMNMSMAAEYSDGVEKSGINVSVTLPSKSTMQGMDVDFSGFPFNTTDFTLNGEYANQSFNGTMTVHLIPGLTLGDIHVNIRGNLTGMTINDSILVFYNYTLPIPGFPTLNETYLNQLLQMLKLTILGEGPGSLYNMTLGLLKCTDFNATVTPIDQNSARISFSVVFQGDLIQLLALLSIDSIIPGGGNPFGPYGTRFTSTLNSPIYSMLNATLYAAKSAQLTMSYSKANRRLDVQTVATTDLKELWNATGKVVQNMYPPQTLPYVQSIFNMTFCSMKSFNATGSYSNGQFKYSDNYIFEGDLNAEVNHIKNAYVDMMNSTADIPRDIASIIKEADLDVSNLEVSVEAKNDFVSWSFCNVEIAPPIDSINATCFRLRRLFNLTSGPSEPPSQNERLKLIVQGGSNSTHSVTLFIDPDDPEKPKYPDEFSSGNTMVWNNMSISKLQNLIFKVWEGSAETVYAPASITPTAPFTIDGQETTGCRLILTSISKSATISIKNTTSAGTGPAPPTYKMLGSFVQVSTDTRDLTINLTVCIYYTHEQLDAQGLGENDLKIFYWDTATSSWIAAETQVNTTEHYAWAVVDHLSTWVIMGQTAGTIWGETWFIATVIVVVAAAVIVATVLLLRRKRLQPKDTRTSESPPAQTIDRQRYGDVMPLSILLVKWIIAGI